MTGSSEERPKFTVDLDDDISIEQFSSSSSVPVHQKHSAEGLREVSERAGFISRSPSQQPKRRTRRERVQSPHTDQKGFKCRPDLKDYIVDLALELNISDIKLLEDAISALTDKAITNKETKKVFKERLNVILGK